MRPLRLFKPLDAQAHDRDSFICGKSPLDEFLRQRARQGMEARVSHTWVLPAAGIAKTLKKPICAYYTLSLRHIERETLPNAIAKRMPRYPLPVFVIAQLAVNQLCQGQGLGSITLVNALRRCVRLSQSGQVPAIAVVLDVLDEEALNFYHRFEDFLELSTPVPGGLAQLFMPMRAIEKL